MRSLLGRFTAGVRGLLVVQLFLSVIAIALAGWTIAVTGEAMQERDHLRERVVQLEGEMAARGIVVPDSSSVLTHQQSGDTVYPGDVESDHPASARGIGNMIGDIFAPPPRLRIVVLHVRTEADVKAAQSLAEELQRTSDARVTVIVSSARQPGYIYYDGRQNRPAADLVASFHDIARTTGVAEWSAQLRGEALPAQGDYTADRLDIVLPPRPPPPTPPAALEPAASPPG